jgi:hypothetical protein
VDADDLVDVVIISADPCKMLGSTAALMPAKLGLPAINKGRCRGLNEMWEESSMMLRQMCF